MVLCMRDWVSLGQRGQAGKLAGKLETRELAAQEPLDEPSSRFNVPLAPAKTRHRVGPGPGVNQLNVDPHGISLPGLRRRRLQLVAHPPQERKAKGASQLRRSPHSFIEALTDL